MPNAPTPTIGETTTRVLRLRLKDRHAMVLRKVVRDVNLVWGYCNGLDFKVWQRAGRIMSGFDFSPYTANVSKEGLSIGAALLQEVSEEFGKKRKAAQKVKLHWACIPSKALQVPPVPDTFQKPWNKLQSGSGRDHAVPVGQVWAGGLRTWFGSIFGDGRGSRRLDLCFKVFKSTLKCVPIASVALGIDLGCKSLVADPSGDIVDASQFCRNLELPPATAQCMNKKGRVPSICANPDLLAESGSHRHGMGALGYYPANVLK